MTSTEKPGVESEWIKKFFQVPLQTENSKKNEYLNDYFQSDDEEEYFQSEDEEVEDSKDDHDTSLYDEDNELFMLPFRGVDFKYPGKDYDKITT